jgi:8-oxo-dGTP diphosphatase
MKTIEVVAGVLQFENKFLCVQRGPSKYDYIHHKFEFPGGKIEENESHEIALKRELFEELNIDSITIINKIITVEHQYPDFKLIMHAYLCIPKSNQLTLKEHIDYKWLNVSEMDTLDWAAADIPILKELK